MLTKLFILISVIFICGTSTVFAQDYNIQLGGGVSEAAIHSQISKVLIEQSKNEILHLINIERGLTGLPHYNYDSELEDIASRKLSFLVDNNIWEHYRLDGKLFDTKCTKVGENLAQGYISTGYIQNVYLVYGSGEIMLLSSSYISPTLNTKKLVNAWMNSPTHRANILDKNFINHAVSVKYTPSLEWRSHTIMLTTSC